MPSIGKTISGHNKKVLKGEEVTPPCVCTRYQCEVQGKCEEKGLIYQCEVRTNQENQAGTSETYIGLTENSFKDRLTKHRKNINTEGYHKNSFSNYIWDLKRRNINFELSWRIVAKSKPYSPATKTCQLCIQEICYILFRRNMSSLNKKNEFFGYCLHKSKFLLQNQWNLTLLVISYSWIFNLSLIHLMVPYTVWGIQPPPLPTNIATIIYLLFKWNQIIYWNQTNI